MRSGSKAETGRWGLRDADVGSQGGELPDLERFLRTEMLGCWGK